LRARLRELAAVRLRAGDQQLNVLLRREGWRVNHKRIYRLYTEEGLALRRRRPRRHRSAVVRVRPAPPTGPHEHWAMDFMQDTLAEGRTVRILTVLDVHTRECVAAVPARSFRGDDVVRVLRQVAATRALPKRIRVDNVLSARRWSGAETEHPSGGSGGRLSGSATTNGAGPVVLRF
jgi:putative transposase